MRNFLDTSAVLNGVAELFDNIYISPLVLSELENIKTNSDNEHLKYLARQAVRDIIYTTNYNTPLVSQRKVNKIINHNNFLQNINDHKIIAEAICCANIYEPVRFITCDANQYLIARELEYKYKYFIAEYLDYNEDESQEEYYGWNDYYPNEEQMTMLYTNPEVNVLNAKNNEFCKIFQGTELKDILFWNGQKYRALNYKEFNSILGEKIKPRNLEQKMYLDLLQNKDIPIKLCTAKFGTGKSYLALAYALSEIHKGNFDKLIFVKNNLEVKGAGKLGTLPGDEIAKQLPWLRQIEDHIGMLKFEEYIENGTIEPAHLSTLRGRDLKNCLIIADEAENLLKTNIQLLLGRVAEGSEIIFCADIKQCDYYNEKNSGIPKLIKSLKGNPLFGMVKLLKTERSAVAATADLLD